MLGKKSSLVDRYDKLHVSSYIWHRKHFYSQLDYNHVQEVFFHSPCYCFRENEQGQKQKVQQKFLVNLERQTRHNF